MKNFTAFGNAGLGTSHIASLGSAISLNEAHALFRKAFELQVNLIDTADTYGSGDAERLIARATQDQELKNYFFIVTKAGFRHLALPAFMSPLNQIGKKVLQKIVPQKNFSPQYLECSLHRSLKRLKTDNVGAFVLHEPLAGDYVPDESWRALERIREKGMAQLTGISSGDEQVVSAGIHSGQVQLVETPVSYCVPGSAVILNLCQQNNIPVIANQVFLPLNVISPAILIKIRQLLPAYGLEDTSLREIMIGYAQRKPAVKCVLFGTRKAAHLAHNAAAVNHSYPEPLFDEINHLIHSNQ
ncbi:aldo/keto reductase [Mucilaginibacter robiniae]|uniref:Aldo/keto reductase n=1 Tax=Mucilaginibacter robiniae TaxID=2728022 RepID=A0A7L5DTN1_9SPHI|nr:aldo/keto reductase [Mucilaginibacter robiniae]QJD94402.1 aldo/keto reductase [Mucilaginibacter robiniae]